MKTRLGEALVPAATDLNLLLGVLTVQMDFITGEELLDTLHEWVRDKGRPVGERRRRTGPV